MHRRAYDLEAKFAVHEDVLSRGCEVGSIDTTRAPAPGSLTFLDSPTFTLSSYTVQDVHAFVYLYLHDVEEADGVHVQPAVQPVDGLVPEPRPAQLDAGQPKGGEALEHDGVHLEGLGAPCEVA